MQYTYFFNPRYDHLRSYDTNSNIGKLSITSINNTTKKLEILYNNPQLSSCFDIIQTYFHFQYKYIIFKKQIKGLSDLGIDFNTKPFESEHIYYVHSKTVCFVYFFMNKEKYYFYLAF